MLSPHTTDWIQIFYSILEYSILFQFIFFVFFHTKPVLSSRGPCCQLAYMQLFLFLVALFIIRSSQSISDPVLIWNNLDALACTWTFTIITCFISYVGLVLLHTRANSIYPIQSWINLHINILVLIYLYVAQFLLFITSDSQIILSLFFVSHHIIKWLFSMAHPKSQN